MRNWLHIASRVFYAHSNRPLKVKTEAATWFLKVQPLILEFPRLYY